MEAEPSPAIGVSLSGEPPRAGRGPLSEEAAPEVLRHRGRVRGCRRALHRRTKGLIDGIASELDIRFGSVIRRVEHDDTGVRVTLAGGRVLEAEAADAGEHELKGVPDRWHLYRAVAR